MTSKLVLHMGMPKTGTSALQVFFAKNRKALEKQDVVYPPSSFDKQATSEKITSGNGVELANFFNPNLPHKGNFSNYLQTLESILKSNKGKTVLFSSEFLSFARTDRYEKMIALLNDLNVELICVFYVRSVVGHAISAYSQYVKRHKYTQTFNHFIKHDLNYAFWTLKNTLEKSGNTVILRNYDETKKHIYKDFLCNVLGIDERIKFEEPKKTVNRSLTKQELLILRELNTGFSTNNQSTKISDFLIYNDPNKKSEKSISRDDYEFLASNFQENIDFINSVDNSVHLTVKSYDIELTETDEGALTDNEAVLTNLVSNLMAELSGENTNITLSKKEEYVHNLNIFKKDVIAGWVWNKSSYRPVVVYVEYDNELVFSTPAERYRKDLFDQKIGHGHHAFRFDLGDMFKDEKKIKVYFMNSKSKKIYLKKH